MVQLTQVQVKEAIVSIAHERRDWFQMYQQCDISRKEWERIEVEITKELTELLEMEVQ